MQLDVDSIDTLIFDVGGVLTGDYSATGQDVLQRIRIDEANFSAVWMGIVTRFGSGHMSEAAVWAELAAIGAPEVSIDEDVMGKPFKEQLSIHHAVFDQIKRLRDAGYTVAILSNTIEPHAVVNREAGVYAPFEPNVYLSHEIGVRKPDSAAYRYVIDQLTIDPKHAIFFDDRVENLPPAAELGMQTYHVTDTAALVAFLAAIPARDQPTNRE